MNGHACEAGPSPKKTNKKKQTTSSVNKKTKVLDILLDLMQEEDAAYQSESQVIFNAAPTLCLDPSPFVNQIVTSRSSIPSTEDQTPSRQEILNERRMSMKRHKILSRRKLDLEEQERLFVASYPTMRLHSFLVNNKSRCRTPASVRASKTIPFSSTDFNDVSSSPLPVVNATSSSSVPSTATLDQNDDQQQHPLLDYTKICDDVAKMSTKLKAITSIMNSRSIHDTSMQKVEEYLMEFETAGSHLTSMSLSNQSTTGGGGLTCVSIYHRPLDDVFFGQLFVDRAQAKLFENGQINLKDTLTSPTGTRSCVYQLGSRDSAKLYLEQFKEILTENGRKTVRITRIGNAAQSHANQSNSQQHQNHPIPVTVATALENAARSQLVNNLNQNQTSGGTTNHSSPLIQALNQQPQQMHHPLKQQILTQNNLNHIQQQLQLRQQQQQSMPNVQVIQPQGAKVILPSTVQTIHPQSQQQGIQIQQQGLTHQITSAAGNIIHIQQQQPQSQLGQQQQHHLQIQTQSVQQIPQKIQIQSHQQQLQTQLQLQNQLNNHSGIQAGQSVQIQTPTGMICTMLNTNTLQAVLQQQQGQQSQQQNNQQQVQFNQQHVIQTIQPTRQLVNHQQAQQHHQQPQILPQPNIQQRIQTDNSGQPQAVQFTQINSSQIRSIQGGQSFLLVNSSGGQPVQGNATQIAVSGATGGGISVPGQQFRPLQVILWPQQQPPAAPAQVIGQNSVQGNNLNTVVSSGGSVIPVNQHQIHATGNSTPGSTIAIANINLSNLTTVQNKSTNMPTAVTNIHSQVTQQPT